MILRKLKAESKTSFEHDERLPGPPQHFDSDSICWFVLYVRLLTSRPRLSTEKSSCSLLLSVHRSFIQHQCLSRRLLSIVVNLQECSVQFVQKQTKKTNLQVPLRYEGRTKRSLFISCLPLVGIQNGRSLWEVSVQSRFLYSDVLHFTFSLCSLSEQCHSTPSVRTCGNVRGVFLCPPGYGTENTASVSDPGEKFLPSLKISLPEWQQNHSMCHIVPLSLKKKKKTLLFLLQEMELSSITVLCFKVKGKICSILEVIDLWLCFLQQLQSVGACNRAASSGLWGLLPALW